MVTVTQKQNKTSRIVQYTDQHPSSIFKVSETKIFPPNLCNPVKTNTTISLRTINLEKFHATPHYYSVRQPRCRKFSIHSFLAKLLIHNSLETNQSNQSKTQKILSTDFAFLLFQHNFAILSPSNDAASCHLHFNLPTVFSSWTRTIFCPKNQTTNSTLF